MLRLALDASLKGICKVVESLNSKKTFMHVHLRRSPGSSASVGVLCWNDDGKKARCSCTLCLSAQGPLEKLLTEQAIAELSQSNDKLKTECERLYREPESWKRVAMAAGLSPEPKDGGVTS